MMTQLTAEACNWRMLVVREGLGCCCGMTLTASDSSRKLSRSGERASSKLFTTRHSLLHADAQFKESCCGNSAAAEMAWSSFMPQTVWLGLLSTAWMRQDQRWSPLFEVDPPAIDELWMLCDVR